ncbi:MAG: hypothetical protein AAF899_15370, partial [Pseudomonadota bacterium]
LSWAGIVVLAYVAAGRATQHPWQRAAVAAGALWLAALGLLSQNAQHVLQLQHNRRDMALAAAMVHRLEQHDRFADVARDGAVEIYVIGALPLGEGKHLTGRLAPPPMDRLAICGLFDCGHQDLAAALRFFGTRDVVYSALDPAEIGESRALVAQQTLDTMEPWPDPSAVRILETGEVLILLGRN